MKESVWAAKLSPSQAAQACSRARAHAKPLKEMCEAVCRHWDKSRKRIHEADHDLAKLKIFTTGRLVLLGIGKLMKTPVLQALMIVVEMAQQVP